MEEEKQLTPIEWFEKDLRENFDIKEYSFSFDDTVKLAKLIEKEQKEKLWTNEEVFDMLYKTDKFLMIDLREYWKTIEK